MPKMNGLAMLKELRKDEWGKKAHFIILTNVNDIDHLFLAMQMAEINDHESFEYYIKSEVKLEQVIEKIKKKLAE
jgi:CheY-like chemotaxis protein